MLTSPPDGPCAGRPARPRRQAGPGLALGMASALGAACVASGCNAILSMDERTLASTATQGGGGTTTSASNGGQGGVGTGGGGGGGATTATGGAGGLGGQGGDGGGGIDPDCLSPFVADACLPGPGCQWSTGCSDVVLLLHFDSDPAEGEDADLAVDFSGHGNDASCYGTACPSIQDDGHAGRAFDFGGSSYFTVSHSPSLMLESAFSVAAWFRPYSLPSSWRPVVAKTHPGDEDAPFWLGHDAGSFCIGYNSDTWYMQCDSGYSPSAWHSLVGTWDFIAEEQRFYVDGQYVAGGAMNGAPAFPIAPVNIGWDPGDEGVDGTIDEVIIWNRVLTPEEVALLATG